MAWMNSSLKAPGNGTSGTFNSPLNQSTKNDKRDWMLRKYSREERCRRSLNNAATGLVTITNFFHLTNREQQLLNENSNLKDIIQSYIESSSASSNAGTSRSDLVESEFLGDLINSGKKNKDKDFRAHRFDEPIKNFASYVFTVGGRKTYEIFEGNLKGIVPSISTVKNTMKSSVEPVLEPSFRFEGLKKHLDDYDLPYTVWISEDSTRITRKIQWDSQNDQISGFVPPLNDDGVPIIGSLPAESYEQIRYFKLSKGKLCPCYHGPTFAAGCSSLLSSIFWK